MHLEEFAEGTTFVHYLDPRIKILTAVLFSVVVALSDRLAVLGAALAVAFILLLLARLELKLVLTRLLIVNSFIIFLWFFLPFSFPGHEVFSFGPLTASREGLNLALVITVKSNAIVWTAIALLSTSKFHSLVHALAHFKIPDKLIHLFFFTFRYFQVIHQEYLRLRAAMRIRCFQPKTDRHTYRNLAYLLGMLLVRSFDRSERVYQAMLCRGYRGRFWMLDHFHLHRRDVVFLGIMILVTTALGVMEWRPPIL